MKRSEKYPETTTFKYYNPNPKNKITCDCVIRSLCTGLDKDYSEVVMDLAKLQIQTGFDDGDIKLYGKYLENNGWIKHKQPRKYDNTKYTGKDWCKYLSMNDNIGPIVANIGGHHVVCIKPTNLRDIYNCRYKVFDTWDSTDGCIGIYWTKGERV